MNQGIFRMRETDSHFCLPKSVCLLLKSVYPVLILILAE